MVCFEIAAVPDLLVCIINQCCRGWLSVDGVLVSNFEIENDSVTPADILVYSNCYRGIKTTSTSIGCRN